MSIWIWRLVAAIFVFFLVSPIFLLVLFSFTDGGMAAFPIERFTFRWWVGMFQNSGFRASLQNSLLIGAGVSTISAFIGTAAAMGLVQIPPRRARVILAAVSLPIMLPPLVLGVALLSFYVTAGLPLGLGTVILSHLLFTLPFVILVIYARLQSFDFLMVESARDLGASAIVAFWTVTFPVIQPSIIGAALLALALSIDDFIITFFTIGTGNTLPTFVWGMVRTALTPGANAIGSFVIFITMAATVVALRLTKFRG